MKETLIETFKRFYFDYRVSEGVDGSFAEAREALAFAAFNRLEEQAQNEDLAGIRNTLREIKEIYGSTTGSNDSVKERFETEYLSKNRLH